MPEKSQTSDPNQFQLLQQDISTTDLLTQSVRRARGPESLVDSRQSIRTQLVDGFRWRNSTDVCVEVVDAADAFVDDVLQADVAHDGLATTREREFLLPKTHGDGE